MRGGPETLVKWHYIEDMCAAASSTPPGCFVEVGVYKGGTGYHLAKVARVQRRPIYLYDTFTGMPCKDAIDHHQVGDFSDTSVEAVRAAIPYATVIQGVFPDSIVEMGPIALVHLDVDQYRSYMEALRVLVPMMVKGGMMFFDDYGYLEGATAAVDEFFGKGRLMVGQRNNVVSKPFVLI